MIGGDHNTSDPAVDMADVKVKLPGDDLPIIVQRNVWIGARAIVLKGVTIGEGSIVAAGSLVLSDVAPYSVVAGVPARLVRSRLADGVS